MKKVLLTAALLFTFAFSYANEDVSKKELPNSNKEALKLKPEPKTNISLVMPECFALSCGTACFPESDCGDCSTPENIEDTFNDLEAIFCP